MREPHAQTTVLGFCERLGCAAYGDECMSAGIAHRGMRGMWRVL